MGVFMFGGTTFTKKVSKEPLKKVQSLILQQINIFRSCYIDLPSDYALSYFMQVTVILL